MKILRNTITLAGACCALSLFGANQAPDLAHYILIGAEIETRMVFDAFSDPPPTEVPVHLGTVIVSWKALPLPANATEVKYVGTITSTVPKETLLSLYNIGLQGRMFGVEITDATADDGHPVYFDAQDGNDWVAFDKSKKLKLREAHDPVDSADANGNKPAKETRIYGLKFSGRVCTIHATSHRRIHNDVIPEKLSLSKGNRMKILSSHNTTPPPNPPGGQDGEP